MKLLYHEWCKAEERTVVNITTLGTTILYWRKMEAHPAEATLLKRVCFPYQKHILLKNLLALLKRPARTTGRQSQKSHRLSPICIQWPKDHSSAFISLTVLLWKKIFPFRVDPASEGVRFKGKATGSHESYFPWKKGGKSSSCIYSP